MTPPSSNYRIVKSFLHVTYTLRILYVIQTRITRTQSPCSYELEKLASNDDAYEVPLEDILGRALYILYMTHSYVVFIRVIRTTCVYNDT